MNLKLRMGVKIMRKKETTCLKIKLPVIRAHLHDLVTFIYHSSDKKIQLYYTHFL